MDPSAFQIFTLDFSTRQLFYWVRTKDVFPFVCNALLSTNSALIGCFSPTHDADAKVGSDEERAEDMLLWHPYGLSEPKTEEFLDKAAISAKGDLQLVCRMAVFSPMTRAWFCY